MSFRATQCGLTVLRRAGANGIPNEAHRKSLAEHPKDGLEHAHVRLATGDDHIPPIGREKAIPAWLRSGIEVVLGKRRLGKRDQLIKVVSEAGWVLFCRANGDVEQLGGLRQTHGVGNRCFRPADGWHQAGLEVDEQQHAVFRGKRHFRVLEWRGTAFPDYHHF